MNRIRILLGVAAVAVACPISPVEAQGLAIGDPATVSAEEVAVLRREILDLRKLVHSMQEQITMLTDTVARQIPPPAATLSTTPSDPTTTPYEGVPSAAPDRGTPDLPGSTVTRTPGLLNPAITAVFELTGATSLEREDDVNSFDLSEVEIAFQAAVDPFTQVDLFLAFPADESPEVEEGYVSTFRLPGALQLKGGRFKTAFGKWNTLHSHAFPTVDNPDALSNYFGEESLRQDGLSLGVLIPNGWDLYMESITEVGPAESDPSFNSDESNLTFMEHLLAFFDTTPNSTIEVGLSGAFGKTGPSDLLVAEIENAGLTGTLSPDPDLDSTVLGFDFTYRWKPVGYNVYRSFLWQSEYLYGIRDQQFLTPAMTLGEGTVRSSGGYSYLEWQFARRWRVGGRYDRSELPDDPDALVWAASGVIRFQPSEWQELRFQIKRIGRNSEAALRLQDVREDTQLFFEWIPIIGAHGAHKY